MRQRVTFGFKDKRRDQRRPVSLAGTIDGVAVTLTDFSFHGIGGCAVERDDLVKLMPEPKQVESENPDEDQDAAQGVDDGEEKNKEDKIATLEFTAADGQQMTLEVNIQHTDHSKGTFGAIFTTLSSAQFDAIERLMFPRRGVAAYR